MPPESGAWLAGLRAAPPVVPLGPLQLAWLGDAVWELHQRLRRCDQPGRTQTLHGQVVASVRADAQARALARLEGLLSEHELDLVRRARNRAGRGPRTGDAVVYGQATGFEALIGWLFLHDPPRLVELLDHLKENDP
ncbi:MAG: ribonuclease III domain-containing protein [Chitinophagaceae bacterium]|nr:ribonuclease III domain-containing protein [Chitinophagaceae bacterium]